MKKLAICGAFILSLGALACSENSDHTIVSEANEALADEMLGGNIQVSSTNQVVTLTGTVQDSQTSARAEEIVRDVDDVERVINQLRTAAGDAPAMGRQGTDPDGALGRQNNPPITR